MDKMGITIGICIESNLHMTDGWIRTFAMQKTCSFGLRAFASMDKMETAGLQLPYICSRFR
jgi:hypothetical protein